MTCLRLSLAGMYLAALAWPTLAQPLAVDASVRPEPRPVLTLPPVADMVTPTDTAGFDAWRAAFRKRALAQGIEAGVFDRAFAGVAPKEDVVDNDRNQAEFSRQIWDYLDRAVSLERVENGQLALQDHGEALARIEARYGVEKEVVVAVWGMETAYGTFRGTEPVIGALATLAYDGRRGRFFEAQLIAALKILQAGDIAPDAMTGSWAGAMGHTQFMPEAYLRFAQDFDGDGRRDIWGDDPTDALASTAAYLRHFGWTQGQPWGLEVRLPRGFDFAQSGKGVEKPVTEWTRLGVRAADGSEIGAQGRAAILLPAGARGAAFLIFDNFDVIARYNPADAYVIGVGHLSDRIAGRAPIRADWPRDDRALTRAERKELQRLLTSARYGALGTDGIVGAQTVAALRAFQRVRGLVPDGFASLSVLERLR